MAGVVGVVQTQLAEVREQLDDLYRERSRIKLLDANIKALRKQERALALALLKLEGETKPPRTRRNPADNEAVIQGFFASHTGPATLSEIASATSLPLSSVRNALLRMPSVTRLHGRLYSVAS